MMLGEGRFPVFLQLWFQTLYLEHHRFDPVCTAGDKVVGIFHPGTKVPIGHESKDDFVNIVPGPFAGETLRTSGNIFHIEFLAFLEQMAGAVVYVRPAVFFVQVSMVQGFQNGDLASREGWHGLSSEFLYQVASDFIIDVSEGHFKWIIGPGVCIIYCV